MTTYNCATGENAQRSLVYPRGYIPDVDWATIHNDQDQPIKPVKQEEDPTETTVTPAAPTEVEGPPSSCLRSKTKQQSTTIKQGQLECNPTPLDQPEHNPAKLEVNNVQVDTKDRDTLVQMALTILGLPRQFQTNSDLPP